MKSSDKWEFASVKATLEDVNNGRTKLWVFGNSPPNYFLFQMGKKSSGKRKLKFIDERKRPGWAPSTSKTSACALQIRPVRLLAPAVSSFAVKPYTFVVDTGSEKMVLSQIVPLRSSASMAWMWSTEVMPGRSNVYLFYNNLEYSGIMQRVLHVFWKTFYKVQVFI